MARQEVHRQTETMALTLVGVLLLQVVSLEVMEGLLIIQVRLVIHPEAVQVVGG